MNIVDTAEAMANPRPGDHYHEMWNFHVYVVAVGDDHVITAKASPPCTFPEDATFCVQTPDEFREHFSYRHQDGYWIRLAGRGCDVTGWLDGAKVQRRDYEHS